MTSDSAESQTEDHRNHNLSERLEVHHNGEEKTVWNWVQIVQPADVRGHNPVVENHEPQITPGDMRAGTPEAVTANVAEELEFAFDVDPEEHDIEVIDPEDEEVTVL